ncbi:hypothetical protein [Halanaerobium congolense]|uniref:Uncharacterized protein n=1 Tax=Halanaerobium congolense TaxID=54121 RepID=A0A1G6TTU0_9FIRM|nr:hypothetical protein [Halanaerobium congolense]PUU88756.1 MAG: transcriptional regulator [Halanaerobium sp.]SDD32334.1 hypothetical protein SAMN04488597_1553 [Halanaerobium congolense]
MSKFKVNCSWREFHSGELIVEAADKEEAVELLQTDQNRLLELLIDKYANETFESLSDIEVIKGAVDTDRKLDLVIDAGEIKVCES